MNPLRALEFAPAPAAPDYASAIVGLRSWRVSLAHDRLLSVFQPPGKVAPWPAREPFVAECDLLEHAGKVAGRRHRDGIPSGSCRCGVYAARLDPESALIVPGADGRQVIPMALGEVKLWGRVVPAEHGWRAEFAYPGALLLPFGTDLGESTDVVVAMRAQARLRDVYGVQAWPVPRAELSAALHALCHGQYDWLERSSTLALHAATEDMAEPEPAVRLTLRGGPRDGMVLPLSAAVVLRLRRNPYVFVADRGAAEAVALGSDVPAYAPQPNDVSVYRVHEYVPGRLELSATYQGGAWWA